MADVLAVRDAYRAQQSEMLVQECAARGLSNRAFCRQREIPEKCFYHLSLLAPKVASILQGT